MNANDFWPALGIGAFVALMFYIALIFIQGAVAILFQTGDLSFTGWPVWLALLAWVLVSAFMILLAKGLKGV